MIDQQPVCDDQQLQRILRSDFEIRESNVLLDHVENCQRCQQRLDELAADESDWQKINDFLSSDAHANAAGEQDGFRPTVNMSLTESMARQLLSPSSHPEMMGRIGRYDVERLIGSGGMGVVFKAYDTELNRPVAIKLLAPYLTCSPAARNRFAREGRAAAAVVDDHVVPIHNVETEGEHPFLVMKYIGGGSLQQRVDREGVLAVPEVLRIGIHTAKGLAAAHAQGLIHRDVKPGNILLDEGVERALLTDFGLARAADDASLTRSGFHPGTPHYMSPEQVRGESIDVRSDLFGLGCVLYALCTGHPPFRSETSYAVLRRITDDTPRPICETNPDVPAWLEQIVMKLLAKSVVDRFDTADDVAELLKNCLAHVQQPMVFQLPADMGKTSSSAVTSFFRSLKGVIFMTSLCTVILAAMLLPQTGTHSPGSTDTGADGKRNDPEESKEEGSQALPAAEYLASFRWSKERDGLIHGGKIISSDGKLQPGNPMVVQFVIRNVSKEAKTVTLQSYNGTYLTLGENNRIELNPTEDSAFRQQHTIQAGKVLDEANFRANVKTDGLPPGKYRVTSNVAFWTFDPNTNRSNGVPFRPDTPITLTIGDPEEISFTQPPQDDDPRTKIYWGGQTASIVVGMRLPAGRSEWTNSMRIESQLFAYNASDKPITIDCEIPATLSEWNMHLKSPDAKYGAVRLDYVWYTGRSPRTIRTMTLKPGEVQPITGVDAEVVTEDVRITSDATDTRSTTSTQKIAGPTLQILKVATEFRPGDPRRLITTTGGKFTFLAAISIRRQDIPNLDIVASAGGAPFVVKAD